MKVGSVNLEFLGHSGFAIRNKVTLVIDPYGSNCPLKADYILITHSHYDHCSIKDVAHFSKEGTVVICTPDSQSKLTKVEGIRLETIEVGDELDFGDFKVEAVPAYNLGKNFHPKSEGWVGYVVKLGDTVIYHAGDSDFIPEMEKLTGYGGKEKKLVALLPVSGKYVMDAEQAAEASLIIRPDVAVPMNYGAGVAGTIDDAKRFVDLCVKEGIRAEILDKI